MRNYGRKILIFALIFALSACLVSCKDNRETEVSLGKTVDETAESEGQSVSNAGNNEEKELSETDDAATENANAMAKKIVSGNNGYKTTKLGDKKSSLEKADLEKYAQDICEEFHNVSVDTVTALYDTQNKGYYKLNLIVKYSGKENGIAAATNIGKYSDYLANRLEVYKSNVTELQVVWLDSTINGYANLRYKKNDGILENQEKTFDSQFGLEVTGKENPTTNP